MADLVVRDLHKNFPTSAEPLVILRGVSFELAKGQNMAVIGPSGCGKSTLLHILGTLDEPTDGTVTLNNQNPFGLHGAPLAEFRNRHIGFVFQDHHLLPQLSVLENVLVPAIARGPASKDQLAHARDLVERVGLSGRADHRPAQLSGGERARAALARALVLKPELILADEPTGNLDPSTAERVAGLLRELQQQEQFMMVVVTHSLDLAASLDRQYRLDAGKLSELSAGATA